MEDFDFNVTSWVISLILNISSQPDHFLNNHNQSNISSVSCAGKRGFLYVLSWIVICTGLPLNIVANRGVCSLVRKDHVAPIYVINLLLSDLIQLCCLAVFLETENCNIKVIFGLIYSFGLLTSVGFMMCISLERYVVIAWPLWYRFRRTIKLSVVVCVGVWVLPFIPFLIFYFSGYYQVGERITAGFFLLPFPLFIFFLGGTIKALSTARSVSTDEKRRIVATLVAVLLIYTLLFLPYIIWILADKNKIFTIVVATLVRLSPLADSVFYIFLRKGATDKLLASLCCCADLSQGE